MRFLGKHKVMAWILAVAIVLSLMSDFSIFEGTKRVYAGDFNDGVYTLVSVNLLDEKDVVN